jgi:nucleoside-diphosphate-sugar epimerase
MIDSSSILVTGGSGFIGSHLIARLLSLGIVVYAPHRGYERPWRMAELADDHSLRLMPNCDLQRPRDIESVMQAAQPDSVVHAAAYGVDARCRDPRLAISTNILGTAAIMEASIRAAVKRFVLIDTAFVYREQQTPIDEHVELQGDTLYGATKAAAWQLASYYHRKQNLPLTTLRLFNVFGPKEGLYKLVPSVISSALGNVSLHIRQPHSTRDFTYVSDVVDALLMAIDGTLESGQVYNVASGNILNIMQLAQLVRNLTGKNVPIEVDEASTLHDKHASLIGDSSKLRNVGWSPAYTLDNGLRLTIDWYARNQADWEIMR